MQDPRADHCVLPPAVLLPAGTAPRLTLPWSEPEDWVPLAYNMTIEAGNYMVDLEVQQRYRVGWIITSTVACCWQDLGLCHQSWLACSLDDFDRVANDIVLFVESVLWS